MKRNKYKDYLWYTALAVFIICVIEGIFFYHNVDNPFLKVTLNIQNAIKAYKIDPDIMLMYGREAQSKTKTASPATIPKSGERNRKIHSCMLYLISI